MFFSKNNTQIIWYIGKCFSIFAVTVDVGWVGIHKIYSGNADKTKKPRVTTSHLGISFFCSHWTLIGENTFRPNGKNLRERNGCKSRGIRDLKREAWRRYGGRNLRAASWAGGANPQRAVRTYIKRGVKSTINREAIYWLHDGDSFPSQRAEKLCFFG